MKLTKDARRNELKLGWAIILVTCELVGQSWSQLVLPGQCPSRVFSDLIDATKIHGTWYELERSPSLAEYRLTCTQVIVQQFYDRQAQIQVSAFNRFEKQKLHAKGSIKHQPDFHQSGLLELTSWQVIDMKWGDSHIQNYTFQVAQTDYNNYLILIACHNHESTAHSLVLWALGRQRHISDEIQRKITENIHLLGLANIKLQAVPQHRCT